MITHNFSEIFDSCQAVRYTEKKTVIYLINNPILKAPIVIKAITQGASIVDWPMKGIKIMGLYAALQQSTIFVNPMLAWTP